MVVLTPGQMRKADQLAIKAGIPDLVLMEVAGRETAERVRHLLPEPGHVVIFAGKGNNGGDGLVAARYLDMWGYDVNLVLLRPGDEYRGSSAANFKACKARSINISIFSDVKTRLNKELERADLVIDAMLGTGLTGEVRGEFARAIEMINDQSCPVVSVDIPSGVEGETGRVLGMAVKADLTVTMACPKVGLLVYPGKKYVGNLHVVDIGIPGEIIMKVKPDHFVLTENEARLLLPEREVDGHKGSFGRVLMVGGSRGMSGAPLPGRTGCTQGRGWSG